MKIDWNAPASAATTRALTRLARGGGGSAAGGGLEATFRPLDAVERLDRLEAGVRRRLESLPPDQRPDDSFISTIVAGARSGLAKIENGAGKPMTVAEATGVEAVILTDGTRPSLLIAQEFVNVDDPEAKVWRTRLNYTEAGLRKTISAVGGIRVPVTKDPVGTVFVIAPGLVITNRHVLEAIADQMASGHWLFRWPNETVVDFVGEGDGRGTSFKVMRVRFAGPNPIRKTINLDHLDLAVLEVEPSGDDFPHHVVFAGANDVLEEGHGLSVIGFPGTTLLYTNGGDCPAPDTETAKVLADIFDNHFGVKRLAPGEVDFGVGEHPKDSRK